MDGGSPAALSSVRSATSTWLDRAADYLHENVLEDAQPHHIGRDGWSVGGSLPPATSPLMHEFAAEGPCYPTATQAGGYFIDSDSGDGGGGGSDWEMASGRAAVRSSSGITGDADGARTSPGVAAVQWDSPIPLLHGGPRPQLTAAGEPSHSAATAAAAEEVEDRGAASSTWLQFGYTVSVTGMVRALPNSWG
jgi:hypothetical protein